MKMVQNIQGEGRIGLENMDVNVNPPIASMLREPMKGKPLYQESDLSTQRFLERFIWRAAGAPPGGSRPDKEFGSRPDKPAGRHRMLRAE